MLRSVTNCLCGAGDALSDLDLWLAVPDAQLPIVRSDLLAFASRAETPLLLMEAPYNGPVGGTFFQTIHTGGETGVQNVDWYLEPLSTAAQHPNTHLLFSRVPLSPSDMPIAFGNPGPTFTPTEAAVQHSRAFWLMLLVCAKYAYRSPHEERMGLLPSPVNSLNEVRAYLSLPALPSAEEYPPHPSLTEKLLILNTLQEKMTSCHKVLESAAVQAGAAWEHSPDISSAFQKHLAFLRASSNCE